MYLSRFKTFIIIFLVVLAVYQTAGLWFGDFSGRSLFYSIFSGINHNTQKEIKYNIESIIISKGNNEFVKKSNGIYENGYKSVFDNAISHALKKGSFEGRHETDWKNILSSRCIIYSFGYTLDGQELKTMYNAGKKLYSKIESFDTVVITPNVNVPESMRIAFLNTYDNIEYDIVLKKDDIIAKANSEMVSLASQDENVYYISSAQNGFELFKGNVFLPRWNEAVMEYSGISVTNPLEEDGGVLLMNLEKNIDVFFENPAVKWSSTVSDIYTYSDENTVVKYYPTGVLEYSSYKSAGKAKPNFSKDYMTALSFLANDENIENEYYLSSYQRSDDKIVFFFDYKINDYSIRFSKECMEKTGMNSMIELTVADNNVVRYKRLVYRFNSDINDEYETAGIDFLSAVDKVYEENIELNAQNNPIDKIELCYNMEDKGGIMSLCWFITIDSKLYVVSAQN